MGIKPEACGCGLPPYSPVHLTTAPGGHKYDPSRGTGGRVTGVDLDPQTLGGVVGIYLLPETTSPHQQPCLALRVIGGPKAYARVWLHRFGVVEWGWALPAGAVCLWTDGELDDSGTRADAPPSGAGP